MKPAWRWGLAVLLLALAASPLIRHQFGRQPAASPPDAAASSASAPADAAPAASSPVPASRPLSPARDAAASTVAPVASVASAPAGWVELCGHGRVSREEWQYQEGQGATALMQSAAAHYEVQRAEVIKRLEAGSLPQRVAAALLREDVEAGASLAASTDDPLAYQLAFEACRRDASYRASVATQRAWLAASAASGGAWPEMPTPPALPTACAALSLERLELLDGGSVATWFIRLSDSLGRKDETGISQALYQIAQRPRGSARPRPLTATVAEVVGADPNPGEVMALSAATNFDLQSLLDRPAMGVGRVCSAGALRDANRRQLCERVVPRLAELTEDILGARVLGNLEERLGLPPSRQSLSKADGDRLMKIMGEDSLLWLEEPSCASFGRAGKMLVALSRQGELAYLRDRLKAGAGPATR